MQHHEIHIRLGFAGVQAADKEQSMASLAQRKDQLVSIISESLEDPEKPRNIDAEDVAWLARSYPVLAILSPVMATHEGKIEFPGDPMCLYSALSVAIDQAVKAKEAGLVKESPYNDLCPRWGLLPSKEYRQQASDSGVRDYSGFLLNTDQTIFDPRVWNDEIMRYNYKLHQLDLAYSSTLRAIDDGRIEPVVDFLISGEGYFVLDLLMKAISLAMNLRTKECEVTDVVRVLDEMASTWQIPGRAVLAAINGTNVYVYLIRGRAFDLASLPSPYRAAAIRARFPIFLSADGTVQRTAHVMLTNACPYHCNFCSEGAALALRLLRFSSDPVQAALERVFEYVSYGAEALFFDDSVFWSGNIRIMIEFSKALAQAKMSRPSNRWLKDVSDWEKLENLQWGAQLTAEFLTTLQSREKVLTCLRAMREGGCTYIYVGIESLAASVMNQIHKNIKKEDGPGWARKIRLALEVAQEAGIRVGSSVLFGLDGETRETIEETIVGVAQLIDEGLLFIASPNILTYHPGTAITHMHGIHEKLDYHSLDVPNKPPYVYFEEAFPNVVSRRLSEEDIWYIHQQTQKYWGQKRNSNPMAPTPILASIVTLIEDL